MDAVPTRASGESYAAPALRPLPRCIHARVPLTSVARSYQNSLNQRFMEVTIFLSKFGSSNGLRVPCFLPNINSPVAVAKMGFLTTSPSPPKR